MKFRRCPSGVSRGERIAPKSCNVFGNLALRASIDQRNVGDDHGRELLRPHRLEELQDLLGKPVLRVSTDFTDQLTLRDPIGRELL